MMDFLPVLNVLLYGAKGDGVTDDTAAIQAAINDSFDQANPSTVFFPATGANNFNPLISGSGLSGTPQTTYLTSYPIFNPYPGKTLLGESGSVTENNKFGYGQMIENAYGLQNVNAPVLCMGQTLLDPVYTVRGKVTTALVRTPPPNTPCPSVTTTTTDDFIQPAAGSTVVVDVASIDPFSVGQWVWVAGGGYYTISAINPGAPGTLTLYNTGTACNALAAPPGVPPNVISRNAQVGRNCEYWASNFLLSQGPLGDLHGSQPFTLSNRPLPRITADFTQPAVGDTVPVQVSSSAGFVPGQLLWIASAGNYAVVPSMDLPPNNITIQNLGTFLSVPPGTLIHCPDPGQAVYDLDGLGGITTTATQTVNIPLNAIDNVTVASTAGFHDNDYIWVQGAGLYRVHGEPQDAVTLSLFNLGGAPPPAAGNITTGAVVSKNGWCVEFFIDPITDLAANEYRQVMSSSGQRGSSSLANAFSIALTNGVFNIHGNSIHATLITTSGLQILNSDPANDPTVEVVAGQLNHVALSYDGVTIRLFINGNLADSGLASGAILQQHMEVFSLGQLCGQWPDGGGAQNAGNGFQIGGIRIVQYPLYQDEFQLPTVEPMLLPYGTQLLLNFSQGNRKFIPASPGYTNITNGSTNLAEGWIIAQQNADQIGNHQYNWLFWGSAGTAYVGNQRVANLGFGSLSAAIHMDANVSCTIEQCVINAARGIDLCRFSYGDLVYNCEFGGKFNPVKPNAWSWAVGFLMGSQWPCVRNCSIPNGGFGYNFVSVEGGLFESISGVTGYFGSFLFPDMPIKQGTDGSYGNTVTLIECYLSDDQATVNDCMLFAGVLGSLNIKGGYLSIEGSAYSQVPVFKIDGTRHADIQCTWLTAAGPQSAPWQYPDGPPLFFFTPATTNPVRFAGNSFYADQGTNYQALMPESGHVGQGPLYVLDQEPFGEHDIFFANNADYTLPVNDFLWGRLRVFDPRGVVGLVLTDTRKLVLPSIAGYARRIFNNTGQDIICIGVDDPGDGVIVPSMSFATIYCKTSHGSPPAPPSWIPG